MVETKIYVGLNDSKTLKQEHGTAQYVSILETVCKNYRIPFSVSLAQGGYMHENGQYAQEKTLILSLIDVDKEHINAIAEDLCTFFRQESVLITEDRVRAYYIHQSLPMED